MNQGRRAADRGSEMRAVAAALREVGLAIDEQQQAAYELYLGLIRHWGSRVNLVSARDLPRLGERHLLESLNILLWPIELADRDLVDIGSGAGFPGIPLAIWQRDLRVVLIEAVSRKAQFLSLAVRQLGIEHRTQVICARAEVLAGKAGWQGRFDVATARGAGPLSNVARWSAPLLKPGGLLTVFKGSAMESELVNAVSVLEAADLELQDANELRWGHGNLVILRQGGQRTPDG